MKKENVIESSKKKGGEVNPENEILKQHLID